MSLYSSPWFAKAAILSDHCRNVRPWAEKIEPLSGGGLAVALDDGVQHPVVLKVDDEIGVVPLGNRRLAYQAQDVLRSAPPVANRGLGHAGGWQADLAAIGLAANWDFQLFGVQVGGHAGRQQGRQCHGGDQVSLVLHWVLH